MLLPGLVSCLKMCPTQARHDIIIIREREREREREISLPKIALRFSEILADYLRSIDQLHLQYIPIYLTTLHTETHTPAWTPVSWLWSLPPESCLTQEGHTVGYPAVNQSHTLHDKV